MKKFNLFMIATFALCWTGCSNNDEVVLEPDDTSGEKSTIRLVVKNTSAATTREASGKEGASGDEIALNVTDGIKVAVFNTDGGFVSAHALTLTDNLDDTYTSGEFQTTSGRKYIYAFANDANSRISLPDGSVFMADFQREVIRVTYTAGIPDITGAHFLLGSLWADRVNIPVGGVLGTPVTLNLEIGRLASKITMSGLDGKITGMDGLFDVTTASYRIGSVAKEINTVGFHIGEPLPVSTPNVTVQSAVHNAGIWKNADTDNYMMFNVDTWANAKPISEYFYITENTTGIDAIGMQYYGNTTFVQFAVKYIPAATEIYNPTTLINGASLSGSTFWTARIKTATIIPNLANKWLIFNENPGNVTAHTDIELTEIREYTDGICYYKYPVQDKNETADDVCKYRVLRNHIYDFKVTAVNKLGEPTDKVDPEEPITVEEQTYIVVEVSVVGWDKVGGDIEI